MKIVEVAKCIDNKDPLGLGRIRVEFIETLNAPIENVTDYTPWDGTDPFVFNPFLPAQINVTPQPNQLVKLIYWDTNNTMNSREYISGPYVNAYDFYSQGADRQLQATTRGVRIKRQKHLFQPESGKPIDPRTKGVISKPEDLAIYGNYGSDLIFTRNGVTIRSGKIDDDRLRKTGTPEANLKPALFNLKKFDTTLEYKDKEIEADEPQHRPITTLVEYDVEDLSATGVFSGSFKVYKIVNHIYNVTDTYNFNQNRELESSNKAVIYERSFSGVTLEQMGRDISMELRKVDRSTSHKDLNSEFHYTATHPFYYKPTKHFFDTATGTTSLNNAKILFDYVNLSDTKAFGLSYATGVNAVPTTKVTRTIKVETVKDKPITIGTIMADLQFLLSYEANVPTEGEKINFAAIDNYEPKQEELLQEVLPKTYSYVRGEPLLKLLELMLQWMYTHVHNPAESGFSDPGLEDNLKKTFQQAKDNILNQKLRIN
jgi:hypothetical protein